MRDILNKAITSHQHISIMRYDKETLEFSYLEIQCNSWFYTLLYYSPNFVLSLAKLLEKIWETLEEGKS